MDRISRFQNPMPLSSGSFSKPPSVQSDGVGVKPLPPLIHDRFRAMVKEREEELRVFGGGAVLPLSTDEIVRLYEVVLSELTVNSKPIITDLTIIAGEQRAHGEGIADAICARIIEVQVDQKLPSLYLLDSIVKNIGKEYIKHFSARLPEVFCEAYAQVHPSMHPAMRHLFGTWSAVFPLSVLQKIEAQLQFSPSVNGQSSGLNSSTASESPRPTHGIHINPKYLEAQRQLGRSSVETFGTEGVSSTGHAGLTTSSLDAGKKALPSAARITRPSSPYRVGNARPLSPSLEEFSMDGSPKRVMGRGMGREEETSEWKPRNWQGNSSQHLKASAAYKQNGGLDLRGPRALISAYGMDEREKNLNRKHQMADSLESNGANQKVGVRTWQNTEEEEFDWEDMNTALADRRQSNDIYPSLRPPGNSNARVSFTTNHDYRGNLSKAQFSSVTNSSVIEDTPRISSGPGSTNKIRGVLPHVAGPSDLTSQIHSPGLARDSLILPHQQPQSNLNAKGRGFFSDNRSLLTSEQTPPVICNLLNTDEKFGASPSIVSTYDPPTLEIRSADAASALTKVWNPGNFQNSHIRPPLCALPPQMQIRGQFGMKNASNIAGDQGLNSTIHSEQQQLGSTNNMSQLNLPQYPNFRPGMVPLNLQNTAQPSLVHPNLLMSQDTRPNMPLPSSVAIPSNAMVPPMNYGYRPNMSFNVPGGPLHSLPRGPLPTSSQALPIGQNIGPINPNPPPGNALTGLFSSLMAQGLISLTKQDSSVACEFDQDSLKVRHVSIINALYTDRPRQCTTCGLRFISQEEHSKHMDWHVSKNRILRNRKTKPSPKWFVTVGMWLSGAEGGLTEKVLGFLPAENTVEKKEDEEEMAVPADEDQNACALCGEPFDDFYSDEMEEWMYKGAVYMYAPAGGMTVGMDRSELGPIVHAKCRSDSHGTSSDDFKKDEGESTEEGSRRKRLRS